MNSKQTIIVVSACAVLAVGGYCGFIKYQTSVFDKKAQQFSDYENKFTKFHMETIGSKFTSRTVQITQEIKDLDTVVTYIAETNFGWNPKTRIYAFKSGSVELNRLLEKLEPAMVVNFTKTFSPVSISFDSKAVADKNENLSYQIGKMTGLTDLSVQESKNADLPYILADFKSKFTAEPSVLNGEGWDLKIGRQDVESNGSYKDPVHYNFTYSLGATSGLANRNKISVDHAKIENSMVQIESNSVQTLGLHLHDLNTKFEGINFDIDQADVEASLEWPKELSLQSAMLHAFAEDDLCEQTPEACMGFDGAGNLITTTEDEFFKAAKEGKVSLKLLPSTIKNKDLTITGSGSMVWNAEKKTFGDLIFNLKAEDPKMLGVVALFIPRGLFKRVSDRELESKIHCYIDESGTPYCAANGKRIF